MYKINEPIIVRFLECDKSSGVTIYLIVTTPSGDDLDPILMQEIDVGLYQATFTPNAEGIWWVRTYCPSKPKNVYSKSYYVGNLDTRIYGYNDEEDSYYIPTIRKLFNYNLLSILNIRDIVNICYNEKLFQSSCKLNIPTQNETDLAILSNPENSNKILIMYHILADVLTKNNLCTFYVYINPSVSSNGTSLLIFNRYIKSNAKVSSMLAYKNPIINDRGVLGFVLSVGTNTNSLFLDITGSIMLAPGNTLLLTGVPSANNTMINLTVVWQEENYV